MQAEQLVFALGVAWEQGGAGQEAHVGQVGTLAVFWAFHPNGLDAHFL